MKKLLALLLAMVMVLSLAACGDDPAPTDPSTTPTTAPTEPKPTEPDPTEPDPTEPVAQGTYNVLPTQSPDNDPYIVAKYTTTEMADGWILVENEGGDTLGYHPDSGVQLIQVEGYAFKDLDKDGVLDGYEDWRRTAEERAGDLAAQMSGVKLATLMSHGGWGSFTTEGIDESNSTYTFLQAGGRAGVTRSVSSGAKEHATWANNIQMLSEMFDWGIPSMLSIDPMSISGMVETMSLASTMDTELAHDIGVATSQQYRAVGVAALLGPQVDLATPIMDRGSGTYGEDPALTRDIASAYVNAMQSTWAEDGTDLGWGAESAYCFTKHFAGAGAGEGGRDDHTNPGRYAVFANDNYEAHLIAYFDGVFNLPGLTGSSGVMPQYAINVGPDGTPYGGEWGGSYNPFNMGTLNNNWEGLAVTDWGIISGPMATWYEDGMTYAECIVRIWDLGGDMLGGYSDMAAIEEAYNLLVDRDGAEGADEQLRAHAYDYILVMMNLEMFENPYSDTDYAAEIAMSDSAKAYGLETQRKSVVMLKNDGTIKAAEEGAEKPTVYVPYVFTTASQGSSGSTPASWGPATDLELLGQYFNVVTDQPADPTGEPDEDGNPTYTENDVVRASADEIAACDYIIVSMDAPFTSSSVTTDEEGYATVVTPPSIQYAEYTATTAREESLGGKQIPVMDPYGAVFDYEKENRSYNGQTADQSADYGDLMTLQYVASVAGDIPVIVSMTATNAMCWHEVEPLADVILVSYNSERTQVVCEIITGQTEPYGLLPVQQPINMEAVEAQAEDTARDMDCYVDAAGNTYDFAFGLNWSGVIDDARVQTYSAAPLTECEAEIEYGPMEG